MINKTVLVHEVDKEVWQRFAGHAKAKGVKVGHILTDVLSNYLKEV